MSEDSPAIVTAGRSALSATAASSSADCVEPGRAANWAARTAVSRSTGRSSSPVQRRPTPGSAAIALESSISAIGLPAAWASTCSLARPRGGRGCTSSSRPASCTPSGCSGSSGKSRSKPVGGMLPRTPRSRTSRSDVRRWAAKASASSESRSSHWASSATTRSGLWSDRPESSVSTAIPVRRASLGTGSCESASAPRSAFSCRSGKAATRSSTGWRSWWSPENARSFSDSRPAVDSARVPAVAAQRAASASSAVLPIPASPNNTSTRPSAGGGTTRPRSLDSSPSRPIRPVSVLCTRAPLPAVRRPA